MDIENVKRVFFWVSFLILMIILMLMMVSVRLTLFFRLLVTVLLALFAAYFRFENKYSFIAIVVTLFAGAVLGLVMAASMAQFWILTTLFVIVFYLMAEVLDRKIIDI